MHHVRAPHHPNPPAESGGASWPPPTASASSSNERFEFHPRATNPELWRTTLPLVVYERCDGHKGLIATWIAIHWLIVLHAARGRRDFGVREIALRARVGRNELTGKHGYIQRLVDLGLLRIVGYNDDDGKFRAPRPVYHLDLWELERLSLEIVPDVLRAQGVHPPPCPAPDPRQTSFLDALEGPHADGPVHEYAPPGLVTAALSRNEATHETGTAALASNRAIQPLMHETGTVLHETGTVKPVNVPDPHEIVTVMPSIVPADARNRDVERENDRNRESESETTRTRELFQEITAQAAQVVLDTLRQQGVITTQPAAPAEVEVPPSAPQGQPNLPDSLTALWQGDGPPISRRDRQQLTMLAGELDGPTDGHGAYWVGRAILIAARCLPERGQLLNVNYLRGMLRRWQREGTWGSDLEVEGGGERTPPPPPRAVSSTPDERTTAGVTVTRQEAQPAVAVEHPAIAAYVKAYGSTPDPFQTQHIVETVTDLVAWQEVLTAWQLNSWEKKGVGNMLDHYQKKLPAAAAEPRPSVVIIHTYPGLTLDQRDHWIRKFHAATSPAEKRAVIARLEQEHPR